MSKPPFDPNSLPSQFRGNASEMTSTPQPARSPSRLIYTEQVFKTALAAVREAQLAVEMQRGHGPYRAEERLLQAQLGVVQRTLQSGQAVVANQKDVVFAEYQARKAAVKATSRAANSNERPSALDQARGKATVGFELANNGLEQERARLGARATVQQARAANAETSLDKHRGKVKGAFERATAPAKDDDRVQSPPLGSRQVENSQPHPRLRPSPGWAADVEAASHREAMRADDRRANERDAFLEAISKGLEERRGISTDREHGMDAGRNAGPEKERGR